MEKASYKDFFDLKALVKQIRSYMPDFDEKRFIEVFEFAANAHEGQMRKDGKTPYIVHPAMVVHILAEMHADEDVLIAGLLHDVPEDTQYTIEDVKKRFGKHVAFLVEGVTKLSKVYYKDNMPSRDVESLKKMFLHSTKDPRVILIKLADRLHNMRTLQHVRKDKQLRIARETISIYVPIANLLGIQAIKAKLEDLCFLYLFPEEYKKLKKKVDRYYKQHGLLVEKLMDDLSVVMKKNTMKVELHERKKNLYSIYKKISEQGKSIDELEDRIAVRVVVDHAEDCYKALGILHSIYIPKHNRFRDYISNPKPNGYQSLHTAVFGPEGFLTEIQIRSEKMQLESEYGIAAHFFYNEKDKILSDKRSLWVNQIIEIDKNDEGDKNFLNDLKFDIFEDRIIVFDVRGTTVDLPAGASVIDFAYALGGKNGDQLKVGQINTKNVPITSILKTGDVIKITTSKEFSPELWWLSFVKTNFAKNQIRKYLKKASKVKKINSGHKFLQKEFDISGLGLIEKMNFRKIKKIVKQDLGESVVDMDELLALVGEGQIRPIDVVKSVKHILESNECLNLSIRIVANNRFGLLKEVYTTLYEHVTDINFLKAWTSRKHSDAYFSVKICLSDVSKAARLFSELEQIDGVRHVYRISSRGMLIVGLLGTVTGLLWIFHPVLVSAALDGKMFELYPVGSQVMIDAVLLLLFLSIFYLTSLMRKYFPIIRSKKRLWILVFSVPALAMTVLLMEVFYFDLQLSWPTIFVEILLIYAYLGRNFMSLSKSGF